MATAPKKRANEASPDVSRTFLLSCVHASIALAIEAELCIISCDISGFRNRPAVFKFLHLDSFFQKFLFIVNISVFDRFRVAYRQKRIKYYVFSNENAFLWTGSKTETFSPS